jgi:nicotinate-nucleotide--dimethylbenzimidazole phosphoribosyltransferase
VTTGETMIRRVVEEVVAVGPLAEPAMTVTRRALDSLTKPLGSLGRLEGLAIWLAGVTGDPRATVRRRAIVVAAADHGVTAQGVSAYPSEVTAQMVANFLDGGAAINVLAALVGADVTVVDVGVAAEIPRASAERGGGGRLAARRIRRGTADFSVAPAMTRAEAVETVTVGLDVVRDLQRDGVELIGIGEMGIGNTTAASAVAAAMTGVNAASVTGLGTGIDDATRSRKVAVIERALELHRPEPGDALGVLGAVGGLEIGALTGVILGAAAARIPVVLDGFITGAAALLASRLAPEVVTRLLAAHRSLEPGHRVVLDRLGLEPVLDLQLRLGEGTGAALAFGLIDAAVAIRDGMATFESASVSGPTDRRWPEPS